MTSDHQFHQATLETEQDPTDVTHALPAYRERLGLDHTGLAAWLHVTPSRLAALAIRPRPDPASPAFANQVRELTDRYGADLGRLADVVG